MTIEEPSLDLWNFSGLDLEFCLPLTYSPGLKPNSRESGYRQKQAVKKVCPRTVVFIWTLP